MGCGGFNIYCKKYITKFDTHKFVIVEVNVCGKLVNKAHFLHNTKVTSSKMQEDKYQAKQYGKSQGR